MAVHSDLPLEQVHYSMQHWSRLEGSDPWPMQRYKHAAACLGYGGDHPHLLVIGGYNAVGNIPRDVWTLDLVSGKWREVSVCWCWLPWVHIRGAQGSACRLSCLVPKASGSLAGKGKETAFDCLL